MGKTPPANRPGWGDLPPAVTAEVEARVGAPLAAVDYPSGGFTPGLAARAAFADGSRAFLKGIPTGDGTAGMYRAEAAVGALLPESVAPALLWSVETGDWLVLSFEDLSGGAPDLSPGAAGVGPALDVVGELARTLTPCPLPDAKPFEELARELAGNWTRLLGNSPADVGSDGWAAEHARDLVALDDPAALVEATAGGTLLHCDLRADNMLLNADGRVKAIDWAWTARGAAWVDAAFFLPQLILAGHTPAEAERLLVERVPAWRAAPEAGVLGFAVALTGYWSWHARSGPGGALGAYRGRAAGAGREWIAHRAGWKAPVPVVR
ncbi:phosphotransferase family protein [Kitasatospora sp. NPDC088346]|uniref:phosphotransferase family protein n=1 Tax=Kitasatospora sp. NPDC088346 TaxID=3364073 RepID=UPI00381204BA